MKKVNAISILCNNTDFLNLIIRNLDKSILETTQIVVFTDTRIGDKTEKLQKLCNKIDAKLITDKEVNKKLKKLVINTPFVDSWTMSLNILMHWYMFKFFKYDNVLFCDDDVIIKKDIVQLFNQNKTFIFAYPLNTISDKENGPKQEININMAKCFNYKLDYIKWKKYYALGAYIIFNRSDFNLDLYEKGLHNFFDSKYFAEVWNQCKSYRSKNIDERFMTMFILKSKIENKDLNKFAEHINCKFEKINDKSFQNIFSKKYIIHIGNNKDKPITYNQLIDLNLIKGKKFK